MTEYTEIEAHSLNTEGLKILDTWIYQFGYLPFFLPSFFHFRDKRNVAIPESTYTHKLKWIFSLLARSDQMYLIFTVIPFLDAYATHLKMSRGFYFQQVQNMSFKAYCLIQSSINIFYLCEENASSVGGHIGTMWNALLVDVHQTLSLLTFKKQVETVLFKEIFGSIFLWYFCRPMCL